MRLQDILERTIANLEKNISVKIILAVDQTIHGEEQRYRHKDLIIGENEIVNTVSKALPKIGQLIVDGKIKTGTKIVIFNKTNKLNVVGNLDLKSDVFRVITVMKKENFKPKPGDIRVVIQ